MTPTANANVESAILEGRLLPTMSFSQKVWALTARIPRGRVTTYSMIARALRCRAPRAVGQALRRNPFAPHVPCHRVVGSDGRLTGFAGGLALKRRMLLEEAVTVRGDKVVTRDWLRVEHRLALSHFATNAKREAAKRRRGREGCRGPTATAPRSGPS